MTKTKQCKRCGKPMKDGHRCVFVIGTLVRLPDQRTATVRNVRHHMAGDTVTVELPGSRFRDYAADELRWVR